MENRLLREQNVGSHDDASQKVTLKTFEIGKKINAPPFPAAIQQLRHKQDAMTLRSPVRTPLSPISIPPTKPSIHAAPMPRYVGGHFDTPVAMHSMVRLRDRISEHQSQMRARKPEMTSPARQRVQAGMELALGLKNKLARLKARPISSHLPPAQPQRPSGSSAVDNLIALANKLAQNDEKEAIAMLQNALQGPMEPQLRYSAAYWCALANLYDDQGKLDYALHYYELAKKHNAQPSQLINESLRDLFMRLGGNEQALYTPPSSKPNDDTNKTAKTSSTIQHCLTPITRTLEQQLAKTDSEIDAEEHYHHEASKRALFAVEDCSVSSPKFAPMISAEQASPMLAMNDFDDDSVNNLTLQIEALSTEDRTVDGMHERNAEHNESEQVEYQIASDDECGNECVITSGPVRIATPLVKRSRSLKCSIDKDATVEKGSTVLLEAISPNRSSGHSVVSPVRRSYRNLDSSKVSRSLRVADMLSQTNYTYAPNPYIQHDKNSDAISIEMDDDFSVKGCTSDNELRRSQRISSRMPADSA